jgi:lipopolysaccharide/colanic/teichoic acid biosynthesis glycosyltransferase
MGPSFRRSEGAGHPQQGWRLAAKHAFDRSVAAGVLLATSPVMIAVAASIRASMGPPVLFRQIRPGFEGRPFELVKFRTMREALDPNGSPRPDVDRLTALGSLLRATSLDELPQLWNVLRGEMSLVGPRPLLMQYLARYTPEQARRHEARPGITGWAQVNGRNALTWEEKFALDIWYVDHWSLWLDAKILALTFARVFQRKGISNEGHVTMPEFMGSEGRAA